MPSPVGLLQTTRIGFLSLDLTEFETWILPLANHAIPIRGQANQTEQITFSSVARSFT